MINKDLVKFRFKKNFKTYDSSAIIQREMAQKLIDITLSTCGKKFQKVFEFGAGTGFLSKNILKEIKFEEYYANDIIEESELCIKNIIRNAKFLSGDIEKITIDEKFNLVLSNAVMQWMTDVDELLTKIRKNLNKEGFFAFTTFGDKNFIEIKETTGVSLSYLKTETLKDKCECNFEILHFEENLQTLCFNSPLDVLKHIKYSGTNGLKTTKWTVSKLKEFDDFYKEHFSMNDRVVLTYNPIYVVLKAK